jgi:hypothetical protein
MVQEGVARAADRIVDSSATGLAVDREMARRVPLAAPTDNGAANRSFEALDLAQLLAELRLGGTAASPVQFVGI